MNKNTGSKKSKTWLWVTLGLLALLIALAIWRSKSKKEGEPIQVEKVTERTLQEMVSASGKVYPEKEIKISSDVSGEIVDIYVKEGDSVKVGQLLVRINPDIYKSAVDRGVAGLNTARSQKTIIGTQIEGSRAALEQAKAQYDNASKAFNRSKKLHSEGVISDAEFETSNTTMRQAEASVKSAESGIRTAIENANASRYGIESSEASLKELKTNLSRTSIYAPVSGIISKLNVEKGERVLGTIQMAGTELMRIANLNAMEAQVEVSENDILRVSMNQSAEIEVDAYLGRKFKGMVTEIANSANTIGGSGQVALNSDQVTNFIVKVRIDPSSYADILKPGMRYPFRPGMSASVDILTEKSENVLTVPIQAVTAREDEDKSNQSNKKLKQIVFVKTGDTVSIRQVETGIQDDNFISIKSGLKAGEEIVKGPYSAVSRKLKSGMKIRIEENKTNKEKE